mgnify:CR=1 FL=1
MFEINGEMWYINFVSPYHPIFRMDNGEYTVGTVNYLVNEKLKKYSENVTKKN